MPVPCHPIPSQRIKRTDSLESVPGPSRQLGCNLMRIFKMLNARSLVFHDWLPVVLGEVMHDIVQSLLLWSVWMDTHMA